MTYDVGADISFYQDDVTTPLHIDFSKMAERAKFVIIRAGQSTWPDRDFRINWMAAKGILPRGSYFFYDSRTSPKVQAQLWHSMFDGDYGEMPLFADFEDNYGGAYGTWKHWYDFLEEVKRLIPNKQIGIYTGYYYWFERTVNTGIEVQQLEYFKQYPLWIAAYGTSAPRIPRPWTDWYMWQFTSSGDGYLYGVESKEIDLNYIKGEIPSNDVPPPPIEIGDEIMNTKGTAKFGTSTNIKPLAGGEAIGLLNGGEYVYGDKSSTGSDIINFTHYYRVNGSKVELGGVKCKVSVVNLFISTETEPGGATPPPEPDPTPDPNPEPSNDTFTATVHDDQTGETWSGVLTKQ